MSDYHEGLEEGIKIGRAEAQDRIAKLEAALQEIEYLDRPQVRGLPRRVTIQQIALDALAGEKQS